MTGRHSNRSKVGVWSLVRTFLWFRRRLLVNQFRMASKGDAGSQFARLLGLLQPFFIAAFMIPGLITTTFGGFLLGYFWASQAEPRVQVFEVVSTVLLFAILVGVVYALVSTSRGAVMPARMQLLPISRRSLHCLELISQVVNPVALGLALGLLASSAGVLFAGRFALGAAAVLASSFFLITFVGLQFAASLVLQWLFLDRRRGQFSGLVILTFLICVGFLPSLLKDPDAQARILLPWLERINLFLPSGQFTEVLAWGVIADWSQVSSSLTLLAGYAFLIYFLTWWIYRHLQLGGGASGARRGSLAALPVEIPQLDPAVAAVAQIQLRQALRSSRGRLALLLATVLVPVLGWVMLRQEQSRALLEALPVQQGFFLALAAMAFGILGLEPIVQNLLASDGPGLARLYLLPLGSGELVVGKILGSGALQLLAVLLGTMGVQLVRPTGGIFEWGVLLLLALAAVAVVAPLGLVLSAVFPQKAELDSWGPQGNPHPVAGLFGILSVLFSIGLPAICFLLLSMLPKPRPWLLGGLLLWLALCALTSWGLTRIAIRLAESRREFLYEISRGQ